LGVLIAVIVDRINAGEGAADLVKDYGSTSEEIVDAYARTLKFLSDGA
jgi:uncharacterized protein (DUF433 family)